MSWLKVFKFLRLIPVVALVYAVPAVAQFEVAPDHFDSNGKNEAKHKPAVKSKASSAQPAVSPSTRRVSGAPATRVGHKRSALRSAHFAAGQLKPKVDGTHASAVGRPASSSGESDRASQIAKGSSGLSQRE